jgi:hypothetical protein
MSFRQQRDCKDFHYCGISAKKKPRRSGAKRYPECGADEVTPPKCFRAIAFAGSKLRKCT